MAASEIARPRALARSLNTENVKLFRARRDEIDVRYDHTGTAKAVPLRRRSMRHRLRSALLLHRRGNCASMTSYGTGSPTEEASMELRTESPRKYVQTRLLNHCAQCGETIFLPEWSEYIDRHRVRHLWECEACGYKFETLVTFPDR